MMEFYQLQYPNIKELGLSEFNTFYSRDPYNIRFLSDHLNTSKYLFVITNFLSIVKIILVWLQAREDERIPVVQKPLPDMYRVISARPKWDSRLILPKLAFPNKYTAYTVSIRLQMEQIWEYFFIKLALSKSNTYCTKCLLGTSRRSFGTRTNKTFKCYLKLSKYLIDFYFLLYIKIFIYLTITKKEDYRKIIRPVLPYRAKKKGKNFLFLGILFYKNELT